jgi:hypothetical protein
MFGYVIDAGSHVVVDTDGDGSESSIFHANIIQPGTRQIKKLLYILFGCAIL